MSDRAWAASFIYAELFFVALVGYLLGYGLYRISRGRPLPKSRVAATFAVTWFLAGLIVILGWLDPNLAPELMMLMAAASLISFVLLNGFAQATEARTASIERTSKPSARTVSPVNLDDVDTQVIGLSNRELLEDRSRLRWTFGLGGFATGAAVAVVLGFLLTDSGQELSRDLLGWTLTDVEKAQIESRIETLWFHAWNEYELGWVNTQRAYNPFTNRYQNMPELGDDAIRRRIPNVYWNLIGGRDVALPDCNGPGNFKSVRFNEAQVARRFQYVVDEILPDLIAGFVVCDIGTGDSNERRGFQDRVAAELREVK